MTQNREPPAFQEYASAMMARMDYRTLSLAERGLLYSMRLECWVNSVLPSDTAKLAKVLGYTKEEIDVTLPAVRPFFAFDGHSIACPELLDYRLHLDAIREKQRVGGKKGVEEKRAKKALRDSEVDLEVDHKVFSKAKYSPDKSKPTQPLKKDLPPEIDPFVAAMEAAEAKDPFAAYEYRKASDGE